MGRSVGGCLYTLVRIYYHMLAHAHACVCMYTDMCMYMQACACIHTYTCVCTYCRMRQCITRIQCLANGVWAGSPDGRFLGSPGICGDYGYGGPPSMRFWGLGFRGSVRDGSRSSLTHTDIYM